MNIKNDKIQQVFVSHINITKTYSVDTMNPPTTLTLRFGLVWLTCLFYIIKTHTHTNKSLNPLHPHQYTSLSASLINIFSTSRAFSSIHNYSRGFHGHESFIFLVIMFYFFQMNVTFSTYNGLSKWKLLYACVYILWLLLGGVLPYQRWTR